MTGLRRMLNDRFLRRRTLPAPTISIRGLMVLIAVVALLIVAAPHAATFWDNRSHYS